MTLWNYNVVIIADRGFRRASLLRFLKQLGLYYIIRLCGNVWISTSKNCRETYNGILGNISLRDNERKYLYRVSYQKNEQVETNLVLFKLKSEKVKKGKKLKLWYIATDIKSLILHIVYDTAYSLYENRTRIEEIFRDLKSRFDRCKYKVETDSRREKLTMCLMISYTIVVFWVIR